MRKPGGSRLLVASAGAIAVVGMWGTPSSSSYLYDYETMTGSFSAGTWESEIPAACGDLDQYDAIVVYGTEGSDNPLPLDGEHPPPQPEDDQHPEPQPTNKGQIILGLGGDDVIYGGNAKDCLIGGAGDDTIYGNNGSDIILGGPGNDELWGDNGPDNLGGGGDDDLLIGGKGVDDLDGGDGTDACYGLNTDTGWGGNSEKDTLTLCESGTPSVKPKLMTVAPEESSQSGADDATSNTARETPEQTDTDEGETVTSGGDEYPAAGQDLESPTESTDELQAPPDGDLPPDANSVSRGNRHTGGRSSQIGLMTSN